MGRILAERAPGYLRLTHVCNRKRGVVNSAVGRAMDAGLHVLSSEVNVGRGVDGRPKAYGRLDPQRTVGWDLRGHGEQAVNGALRTRVTPPFAAEELSSRVRSVGRRRRSRHFGA